MKIITYERHKPLNLYVLLVSDSDAVEIQLRKHRKIFAEPQIH